MMINPLISACSGNLNCIVLHRHVSTQWLLSGHKSAQYVLCDLMYAQYALGC